MEYFWAGCLIGIGFRLGKAAVDAVGGFFRW